MYASKGKIKKGNIVLIDLRSSEKAVAGRIVRSVSIPHKDLENQMSNLPKKALVVLYSDSDREALDAFNLMRKAGFKKVEVLEIPDDPFNLHFQSRKI